MRLLLHAPRRLVGPPPRIRWRSIESQFLQRDVHVDAAYQILYRTSDVDPNQPS